MKWAEKLEIVWVDVWEYLLVLLMGQISVD